jgi:hypothetical protein
LHATSFAFIPAKTRFGSPRCTKTVNASTSLSAFLKLSNGEMPVASRSSDGEKVFLKDQVLEAPKVEGRLYVSRKERRHDERDPPAEPYDLYAPGTSHDFDVIT